MVKFKNRLVCFLIGHDLKLEGVLFSGNVYSCKRCDKWNKELH